jgi:cytochrome bd-type quinol oxidase subunit 2
VAGLLAAWRSLPPLAYPAGLAAAVLAALLIGIPTDVVPNPWFTRMTPVRVLDIVFLVATAALTGALVATYVAPGSRRAPGAALGSGLLSVFAVGCPVCNKLVVGLLGTSGALSFFAPLQPLIGAGAVVIALLALRARLRTLGGACPAPGAAAPAG